ncbi:HupE/UreJ family protein [Magnetovibrio sp. PR-2]|uniref:HupE/UreJ family protein n=1 Tax=Magnetovibrio sp. PR-2 TaxID=3120356 RepID=UPI002FCE4FE5
MKSHYFRLNALTWGFLLAVTLIAVGDQALAHGMSDAEKQSILDGGNWSFLWLGATHMLSGYDHLAFVFGIIFFLTKFRDIVKYVTAFTLGHSVTLIFATFNAIQINYYLIDAVIALSVCYIAFANLDGFRKVLKINPPNMMAMIAGLGLIHGFGLSTRLQQLPLDPENLLMNIISFNVGVEFGQVTALAAMLAVISLWRNRDSFLPFSLATNYSLIALGGFLFLMQMHDYYQPPQGEELASVSGDNPTIIREAQAVTVPLQSSADWRETYQITLPGGGEKEFKLQVEQGKSLEYAWSTDGGDLFFDMHGEPAGDTTGAFESYQVNVAPKADGTLEAPFTGTHGWYWKNETGAPVTITLNVRGDYQPMTK